MGEELRQGERVAGPLRRRAIRRSRRLFPAALLSGRGDHPSDRSHLGEPAAYPAHTRHRHGEDIHRVPDRVEAFPQLLEPKPRGEGRVLRRDFAMPTDWEVAEILGRMRGRKGLQFGESYPN